MRLSGRFAICELTGGLGNQLFQYAAARALCIREGRTLYFAWHLSRGNTARSFMLDHYQLGSQVHPSPLARSVLRRLGMRSPLSDRKAGRLWRRLRFRLDRLVEPRFSFAELHSEGEGVVLEGYFQSWRYFIEQERDIRAGLTLRHPLTGEQGKLLRQIESENALCLHVRRGDYVTNPVNVAYHGALDLSYYQAALAALGPAAVGATLYVFSDDPTWSREHIKLDRPTVFVEPSQPEQPWEDLRLMAACRHFVVANSSFSWWGAWLASHPDKRVIAPKRWFAGAEHDTRDLCPPDWIRL
jgi:hypothetical protein